MENPPKRWQEHVMRDVLKALTANGDCTLPQIYDALVKDWNSVMEDVTPIGLPTNQKQLSSVMELLIDSGQVQREGQYYRRKAMQ